MVAEESTLQKERSFDCDVRSTGEGHKGRSTREGTWLLFRLESTGTRPGGERTGVVGSSESGSAAGLIPIVSFY